MLTTLLDLLSTSFGIGAVLALTAAGVAVLPWSASDASRAEEAIDALVRWPFERLGRRRDAALAAAPARSSRGL